MRMQPSRYKNLILFFFSILYSLFLGFVYYVVLNPVVKINLPQEILWLMAIFSTIFSIGCFVADRRLTLYTSFAYSTLSQTGVADGL